MNVNTINRWVAAGLTALSLNAQALQIGDIVIEHKAGESFRARIPLMVQWDGYSTLGGNITGFHRYIDILNYEVIRSGKELYLIIKAPRAFTESFVLTLSMTYRDQMSAREYLIEPKARIDATRREAQKQETVQKELKQKIRLEEFAARNSVPSKAKPTAIAKRSPPASEIPARNKRPMIAVPKNATPKEIAVMVPEKTSVATTKAVAIETPSPAAPQAKKYTVKSIKISAKAPKKQPTAVMAVTPSSDTPPTTADRWYPRAMTITVDQAIRNNQEAEYVVE